MGNEFLTKANSKPMIMVGVFVFFMILMQATIFLVRGYREASKIGMDKKTLKNVIVSSSIFSILPSIGILFGVIALSGVLGFPLPWIRLSVVGALHYETLAADFAMKSSGIENGLQGGTAAMTPEVFVSVALIMTIGIIWGLVFLLFFLSKITKGVKKISGKDPKLGQIAFASIFIALTIAYMGIALASWITKQKDGTRGTPIAFSAFVVAIVSSAICDLITKKTKAKWLENFSVSISMFLGMGAAILMASIVQ